MCDSGRDLKPLCLVNRVFRSGGQRILFEAVNLRPQETVTLGSGMVLYGRDPTEEFARTIIAGNHGIAEAIRELRYTANPTSNGASDETVRLLGMLGKVEKFSLVFEGPGEVAYKFFGNLYASRHAQAVLSVVLQPYLKTLKLRNGAIPVSALKICTKLETLKLKDAKLDIWPYKPSIHKMRVATRLKNLKLKGNISVESLRRILQTQANIDQCPVKFDRLKKLVTHLPTQRHDSVSRDGVQLLLAQATSLEELQLEDMVPISDVPVPITDELRSPIACLNPQSFTSLTQLIYRIHISVDAATPDCLDPYHGLFRDPTSILQLVSLESFALDIVIDVEGQLEPGTIGQVFGVQWGQLDSVLVPVEGVNGCALPHLGMVAVSIRPRVTSSLQVGYVERVVERTVLRRRFSGFKNLYIDGEIDLALRVEAQDKLEELDIGDLFFD
ncbi:hypothetical protein DFP72DRAFT_1073954 [Ephemerocybe angulata]|uniref:Uncharacterized protein n=1 Tax=Ephemerocybe angulata TaxID=980116 RepID=A0A8H6HME4_9AGAR|nr:hypothetical protein DFP72DRAFT_1073954 [Tulosesus angulatus]